MERRILGLIVASGGGSPLGALGVPEDIALLPFAGKYRVIDFALATFVNSGVHDVYVCAPGRGAGLREHVARVSHIGLRARFVLPLPAGATMDRARRLRETLEATRPLVAAHQPDSVVVLFADDVLLADLGQLLDAHDRLGADMTLAGVPLPAGEARGRIVLTVDGERRIHDLRRTPGGPAENAGAFVLTWPGAAAVRAAAIPSVLAASAREGLGAMCGVLRLHAYDLLENRLPGALAPGAYWHEPGTLEAYYGAQMALCTPHPPVDLYNPEWPLPSAGRGLAPAKVVTDAAGRAGQALDSLVSDGSVIHGGVVVKSVLGHGVVIDSGAEVDDCVLLDGCRIGRGARVRRAVVGTGAVIEDRVEIGYDAEPPPPARLRRSGLTIVPPAQLGLASRVDGAA